MSCPIRFIKMLSYKKNNTLSKHTDMCLFSELCFSSQRLSWNFEGCMENTGYQMDVHLRFAL